MRSGVTGRHSHRAARTFGVGLHVLGAVAGGYALTALAVAALGAVMAQLGLARAEAVTLAAMLGFVTYLALLLWAFAEQRLARLWGALACGLAVCFALLRLIPAGA